MQENFGNLALQCDLLALKAMIEAAGAGGAGQSFAQQATRLRTLSQELCRDYRQAVSSVDADRLMRKIENRLAELLRRQDEIMALAEEISANSRQQIRALQFEDVESRVVVYSKDQAHRLRAQVKQIESRQQMLEMGIAANQDELEVMVDLIKGRLAALPQDSAKPAFLGDT